MQQQALALNLDPIICFKPYQWRTRYYSRIPLLYFSLAYKPPALLAQVPAYHSSGKSAYKNFKFLC